MMHALIRNDAIALTGPLPWPTWPDPDAGRWWDMRDPAQVAEAGWVEVVIEPRPDDTATTTWERTEPTLVNGLPVIGWTEVPKTPERIAAEAEAVNGETIRNRFLDTDLPKMQAIIDQTNADLRADPAQEIKDVARAVRRLDRLVGGYLDAAD